MSDIKSFSEFASEQGDQVNEQSLSRVWQHTKGDYPVAILTAFRGSYSYKQNVKRNKALASKIRRAGYGYFFVDGYWIENEGEDDEQHVSEDSIFVIGKDANSDQEFIDLISDFAKQYDQDGSLIKTSDGDVAIYDQNGRKDFGIGKFSPNKVADNYTRLRNKGKHSRTFVFESAHEPTGFIGKYIEKHKEQED
jgi:hypothetical protein